MNTMDTESANILKILEIPKETKYWLVRAGRGEEYEDFKQSSSIGIQYNQISLENLIQLEKISINVPELTPSRRKRKSETIEKEYNKKKKDLYTSLVLRNIRPKPSKNGASQIGSRLQNFYNKMNIGDIVIVPYRSSRKFLIGIISSEMYELTDDEYLELKNKVELNSIGQKISVCKKRRKITWVNEVNREWINPKLLYTVNMHQSVIDITDYGKYIDGLLSPMYIKDNKIHTVLQVTTNEEVSLKSWQAFYSFLTVIYKKEKISIKNRVESPGIIEIIEQVKPTLGYISIFSLITYGLFGNPKNWKGVIPWIISKTIDKEKNNVDLIKGKIDIAKELDKNPQLKEYISNEDLVKIKITIPKPSVEISTENQMQMGLNENQDVEESSQK